MPVFTQLRGVVANKTCYELICVSIKIFLRLVFTEMYIFVLQITDIVYVSVLHTCIESHYSKMFSS